jgi:hypothetical protein
VCTTRTGREQDTPPHARDGVLGRACGLVARRRGQGAGTQPSSNTPLEYSRPWSRHSRLVARQGWNVCPKACRRGAAAKDAVSRARVHIRRARDGHGAHGRRRPWSARLDTACAWTRRALGHGVCLGTASLVAGYLFQGQSCAGVDNLGHTRCVCVHGHIMSHSWSVCHCVTRPIQSWTRLISEETLNPWFDMLVFFRIFRFCFGIRYFYMYIY